MQYINQSIEFHSIDPIVEFIELSESNIGQILSNICILYKASSELFYLLCDHLFTIIDITDNLIQLSISIKNTEILDYLYEKRLEMCDPITYDDIANKHCDIHILLWCISMYKIGKLNIWQLCLRDIFAMCELYIDSESDIYRIQQTLADIFDLNLELDKNGKKIVITNYFSTVQIFSKIFDLFYDYGVEFIINLNDGLYVNMEEAQCIIEKCRDGKITIINSNCTYINLGEFYTCLLNFEDIAYGLFTIIDYIITQIGSIDIIIDCIHQYNNILLYDDHLLEFFLKNIAEGKIKIGINNINFNFVNYIRCNSSLDLLIKYYCSDLLKNYINFKSISFDRKIYSAHLDNVTSKTNLYIWMRNKYIQGHDYIIPQIDIIYSISRHQPHIIREYVKIFCMEFSWQKYFDKYMRFYEDIESHIEKCIPYIDQIIYVDGRNIKFTEIYPGIFEKK